MNNGKVSKHKRTFCMAVATSCLTLMVPPPSVAASGIHVISARIGCLDIQHRPNLTALVKRSCDGRDTCIYKAPTPAEYKRAGVHARTRTFCTQAMQITYECGNRTKHTIMVNGDAWKRPPARLKCPRTERLGFSTTNKWKKPLTARERALLEKRGPANTTPALFEHPHPHQAKVVHLSRQQWTRMLDYALRGLSVKINDFDPANNQPYACGRNGLPEHCGPAFGAFKRNDSFIRYIEPPRLSGIHNSTMRFTPGFNWQNPFLFLINNINMRSGYARVREKNGFMTLVLPFESNGREIVAACHSDVRCGNGDPRTSNSKPAAEINNLIIRLPIGFWVSRRQPGPKIITAFGKLTFTADIHRAGECRNNALAVFCDWFGGDIERRVREGLSESLNRYVLSNPSLSHILDQIVNHDFCRYAQQHGNTCSNLRRIAIERNGSISMFF